MKNISLALLLFWIIGCTPEAPPTINAEDRKLIDSLYLKQVEMRKPELDSLCNLTFDVRVRSIVDSVLAERQEEIDARVQKLNEIKAAQ